MDIRRTSPRGSNFLAYFTSEVALTSKERERSISINLEIKETHMFHWHHHLITSRQIQDKQLLVGSIKTRSSISCRSPPPTPSSGDLPMELLSNGHGLLPCLYLPVQRDGGDRQTRFLSSRGLVFVQQCSGERVLIPPITIGFELTFSAQFLRRP